MSNVCMRSYEVYAVFGQMGNSFHHLSKLCAETGQVVKYKFIIPKFYFETEQMQKTTTNIPMSQLCLLACFNISSVISVKSQRFMLNHSGADWALEMGPQVLVRNDQLRLMVQFLRCHHHEELQQEHCICTQVQCNIFTIRRIPAQEPVRWRSPNPYFYHLPESYAGQ